MQVFRFMSKAELIKFQNGETLYNDTRHKAKTNSIGFCFFSYDDFNPEFAWKFIKGAIIPDLCAVFEVDDKYLKKGYGIYNDPMKTLKELMNFTPKFIKVNEYSTTQYSNENFKLIKYTTNKLDLFINYDKFEWKI